MLPKLRLLAETRGFWQDGVCETAKTSFANYLKMPKMPKMPKLLKLPKLFWHFGIISYNDLL
jgi:hypothetical protein